MFIVKYMYGTCDFMAVITQDAAKAVYMLIHLTVCMNNGPGGSQTEHKVMKLIHGLQMLCLVVKANLDILWCPLIVSYLYHNSKNKAYVFCSGKIHGGR